MLERLPLVDVQYKAPQPASGKAAAGAVSGGDGADVEAWEVEVELRRRRGGRAAARVHAPRFPKARLPSLPAGPHKFVERTTGDCIPSTSPIFDRYA